MRPVSHADPRTRLTGCGLLPLAAAVLYACSNETDGSATNTVAVTMLQRCDAAEHSASPAPLLEPDARRAAFFAERPLPQLQQQGGRQLHDPRIVAVFFGADPLQAQTEAVLQSYGCSQAWRDAVAEYGVHDARYERSIVMKAFPDMHDRAAFEDWMRDNAQALDLRAQLRDRVYVFYPPPEAYSSDAVCDTFFGSHAALALHPDTANAVDVVYAIVDRCALVDWMTVLDQRVDVTTRELIGMAVDPFPSAPAWRGFDGEHLQLDLAGDADEITVPCANASGFAVDYPYPVASAWSNRRAQAGWNPCTSDDRPFGVAYPSVRSVDMSSGEGEFDIDYFADDPELDFKTYATVISSGVCVNAVGISQTIGAALDVQDGTRLHVALREPFATCAAPHNDDPKVIITLRASDGPFLPNAVVRLTGL